MAAGDTQITIVGNLVDDPELRFTPSGQPVARFRVASTPRIRDNSTGEWKDGDSLFLTCNVWRQAAENVAESLQRGMRVIVSGRLRQRSYETQQGEKRTVFEVEVDDVGPSLLRASAKVTRAQRTGGDGSFSGGSSGGAASAGSSAGGSGGGQRNGGGSSGGSWSGGNGGNSAGNRNADPDPWASSPDPGGYSDEPPF
jgi:single-strand DNA-binding protein